MKQSIFGLRSSVLGLLIFLFSASQVECANQDKPSAKKQTSCRISPRVLNGLKYFGGAAITALLIWCGCKIKKQKREIEKQNNEIQTKIQENNTLSIEIKNLQTEEKVLGFGYVDGNKIYYSPNPVNLKAHDEAPLWENVLEMGYYLGNIFNRLKVNSVISFRENFQPLKVSSINFNQEMKQYSYTFEESSPHALD